MNEQQCEAPDCDRPADFSWDYPTPGGTIHMCARCANTATIDGEVQ